MNKEIKQTATTASRELALYAVNDYSTYKQITTSAIRCLKKKYRAGTFDPANIKAFYSVATFAAKRYVREFCDSASHYYEVFSTTDRRLAAAELLDYYMEDIVES